LISFFLFLSHLSRTFHHITFIFFARAQVEQPKPRKMSSYNSSNCQTAAVPDDLPIPSNITYAVIPGQNASVPWMVNCCDPYPVQLVESCWLWCQVSPGTGSRANASDDAIFSSFSSCLRLNDRDLNVSSAALFHSLAPRAQSAPLLRAVVVALLAATMMMAISTA
jgi:hypothetical protein